MRVDLEHVGDALEFVCVEGLVADHAAAHGRLRHPYLAREVERGHAAAGQEHVDLQGDGLV